MNKFNVQLPKAGAEVNIYCRNADSEKARQRAEKEGWQVKSIVSIDSEGWLCYLISEGSMIVAEVMKPVKWEPSPYNTICAYLHSHPLERMVYEAAHRPIGDARTCVAIQPYFCDYVWERNEPAVNAIDHEAIGEMTMESINKILEKL